MASDGFIEPESFDVSVLGTGLQETMLAAAAAAARLSVLHLDPHEFYGAHWTSLDLKGFSSWATSGGFFSVPSSPLGVGEVRDNSKSVDVVRDAEKDGKVGDSTDLAGSQSEHSSSGIDIIRASGNETDHPRESVADSVGNGTPPTEVLSRMKTGAINFADRGDLGLEEIVLEFGKSMFSSVKVCEFEGVSLGSSRAYNIDLCGPRLTFCGSSLVNMLLRSGASHYVEFKGIDASYIWTGTEMSAVPSSRADVFKDRSLSLPDKRHLMRFFKLVTDYATSESQSDVDISREDLDGPFVDFLQRQRLPASIQSYRAVPTGGHGL